jgi:hypothetical protein
MNFSLIQGVEILPDGSTRPGNGFPVNLVRPSNSALFVSVSGNQARIDRKSGPVDQPLCHAAPNHGLEHVTEKVAIAEAAVPVLGEGRMVGHIAVET